MWRGVALKIAATLAFSLMNALIKASSERFPVGEVVLFRSLFALATLVVWLARRSEFPSALRTQRPFGHIGRSLAGSGGMFANFAVLALLPLADATAFTFATPLMVVPLAVVALGEIVRPARWAAVGLGFLGVLVMLSDHLGEGLASGASRGGLGAAIAMLGAVSSAFAMIQTRRLTLSEPTGAIVFYFSSVTTALSALLLIAAALWPEGAAGADFARSQRFVAPGLLEFAALATIWRIAHALDVSVESLMRGGDEGPFLERSSRGATPILISEDGLCRLAVIGWLKTVDWLQWYDFAAEPGGVLGSEAHPRGSVECLSIIEGELEVDVGGVVETARAGETLRYRCDRPHRIRNLSSAPARAMMVCILKASAME